MIRCNGILAGYARLRAAVREGCKRLSRVPHDAASPFLPECGVLIWMMSVWIFSEICGTLFRGGSNTMWREVHASFSGRGRLFLGGCGDSFGCAGYLLRGEGSMRFHPKRRESTDHKPGPSMASAIQEVAARR